MSAIAPPCSCCTTNSTRNWEVSLPGANRWSGAQAQQLLELKWAATWISPAVVRGEVVFEISHPPLNNCERDGRTPAPCCTDLLLYSCKRLAHIVGSLSSFAKILWIFKNAQFFLPTHSAQNLFSVLAQFHTMFTQFSREQNSVFPLLSMVLRVSWTQSVFLIVFSSSVVWAREQCYHCVLRRPHHCNRKVWTLRHPVKKNPFAHKKSPDCRISLCP